MHEHSNHWNFRQASAEVLLAKLEAANTLLDAAEAGAEEETASCNRQSARSIYDMVFGFLLMLPLNTRDRQQIEERLDLLKARLLRLGYKI
jgi:hypothetical protein